MNDWQIQVLFRVSDAVEAEELDTAASDWPRVPALGELVTVTTSEGVSHSANVSVVHWLPADKLVIVAIR